MDDREIKVVAATVGVPELLPWQVDALLTLANGGRVAFAVSKRAGWSTVRRVAFEIARLSQTKGFTYPMRCKWCGNVHDAAKVSVVQRYADCSAWRCPDCGILGDDRPVRWGGSFERVEQAPKGQGS